MPTIERPAFKSGYRVGVADADEVILLAEHGSTVLRGRLYAVLVPLIDGCRSADELVLACRGTLSPAEVYYGLARLESQGFLVEFPPGLPPGQRAFWEANGCDPGRAARRLGVATVEVLTPGVDEAVGHALVQALAATGAGSAHPGKPPDLRVVVVDDYLRDELSPMNRWALDRGQTWMLAKPFGLRLWIGPIIRPGQTGCWECLAQRLRLNRPFETFPYFRAETSGSSSAGLSLPTALPLALGLVSSEAARFLAGSAKALDGEMLSFDLITREVEHHRLTRRPQCPACGSIDVVRLADAMTARVEAETRTRSVAGERRTSSVSEVVRRYSHHVSPITGVVAEVKRLSAGEDPDVHVYRARHGLGIVQRAGLSLPRRACSYGTGTTDLEARASALAEAIERYCGVFQGDEPRRRDTVANLGPEAIHPDFVLHYSDRQYAERARWNQRRPSVDRVPLRYDPERAIDWTPFWSLTAKSIRYLPTAYCYYGYPQPPDAVFCWADSNGNAAGNGVEDAILRGLLELVERDSVALWWYNRARRPGIDLERLGDSYVDRLRAAYHERGRDLWVLDLTSDLGIPVAAAVSRRSDRSPEHLHFGFGAHLNQRAAVRHAVAEASLMLFRDSMAGLDDHPTEPAVAGHPYLTPDPESAAEPISVPASPPTENPRENLQIARSIVEKAGLEVLVLDLTRPDVGLSVVKVVVPGLRHFRARLAPGRLYDVPVRLGWVDRRLAEDALNPTPLTV